MTGVSLTYRIDDHALLKRLAALADFDSRAAFEEIGEHLVSSTVQRFRDSLSSEGDRWLPSRRVLESPGDKTLVDYGHLRQSITYRAQSHEVEVGSNLTYAAIHQFGGRAGRNHASEIDARPFLGISGEDQAEIDSILARHLEQAMR